MIRTYEITFDIVGFIEKNPVTRLNNDYQNNLINKIKNQFNEEEQKIFVTSFYCYLNFNPVTDFIIDFDDIWKWCGFSRKDAAKRILEKHFNINTDYKIALPLSVERKNEGGFNKERITLSVRTFKKFCLKSDTKKSNDIHDYYIKLEEILHETLLEQTDELQLQLQNKTNELEETKEVLGETQEELDALSRKYVKKPKEIFEDKNVVYLIATDDSKRNREYAVGKAIDLSNRKNNYDGNKLHDFEVIYYKTCGNVKAMDIVESIILSRLGDYRCKADRDVFKLPEKKNIKLFTDIFDDSVKIFQNVREECMLYPKRSNYISDKERETKKKYLEEHKEELDEKKQIFRSHNREFLAEIAKEKREEKSEEKSEEISEKRKQHYEENKEEYIDRVLDHYYENKDVILEERKEYYQENKDTILEERKEYYQENYKTKIAPYRQEKVTCECGLIVSRYQMSKHKKTIKHITIMENKDCKSKKIKPGMTICDCGMVISDTCMKNHLSSKQHLTIMKNRKEEIEEEEIEEEIEDEDEEKDVVYKFPRVICECGMLISEPKLDSHKKSQRHLMIMKKAVEEKEVKPNKHDKIICECGMEITRYCMKKHLNSSRHIGIMEKNNVELEFVDEITS